jgi:hypothetical protein
MAETDAERIERQRAAWQFRAIQATEGPRTKLGRILLAVLRKQRNSRPQFVGSATITSDGFVTCDFIDQHGQYHYGDFVCDVADLVHNFRGLAEHLRLKDAEAEAMFQEVRNWIGRDYRVDGSNKANDLKPVTNWK